MSEILDNWTQDTDWNKVYKEPMETAPISKEDKEDKEDKENYGG